MCGSHHLLSVVPRACCLGRGGPSDGRGVCVAGLKGCGGRPGGRGEAIRDQEAMGRESGRLGGPEHVLNPHAPRHAFCSVNKSRVPQSTPEGLTHLPQKAVQEGASTEDPRCWRLQEITRRVPCRQ